MCYECEKAEYTCAINKITVDFFGFVKCQASRPDFVWIVGHDAS